MSGDLDMECLMDHIVLNVEDVEKMIKFYSEVLLLDTERLGKYRSGEVPFPSVRLNANTIIDLFPPKMRPKAAGTVKGFGKLNHFCISLSRKEWEHLGGRLAANHVAIEEGPVPRWGAHGTGMSIYFRDPEYTLIEARHYEGNNGSENCLLTS